jgi:hypothetical protein
VVEQRRHVDAEVANGCVHPPFRTPVEIGIQAEEGCEGRTAPTRHNFLHDMLLVLRRKVDRLFARQVETKGIRIWKLLLEVEPQKSPGSLVRAH